MRVGLYYSLIDWRFPGAMRPMGAPDPVGIDLSAMVDQAHAQVRELMTNFGKVDLLWYDGPWPGGIWRSKELNAMARSLQPGLVINNRSDTPEDYGTPEGHVTPEDRPWESCMMIGDTWGYNHADRNNKTPCQLLHILLSCVAQGGNLLLNVGPDGDGRIPRDQLDILKPLGEWVRRYGEVVYGASRSSFSAPGLGFALSAHGREYLIPHRWHGSSLTFGWCERRILSARVVATNTPARVEQRGDRVWLHGLPLHAPDPWANPIEIVFEERA
jgi:alpha-L-fucosidase